MSVLQPTLTVGHSSDLHARSAAASAARSETVKAVLIAVGYFLFTQTGFATRLDGVLYVLGLAILMPAWQPYLLLLVLSVHDAPGQADPLIYVGTCGISALMGMEYLFGDRRVLFASAEGRQTFRAIAAAAVVLSVWGVLSSFIQHRFGLHEQSPTRPFAVVGLLMIQMIVTAVLCHRKMAKDPWSEARLTGTCACAVIHTLLIALLQLKLGPTFAASASGKQSMMELYQLMYGGARGLARLTGPYLSPNTLAMIPALYMLLFLHGIRKRIIPIPFIVLFVFSGLLASYLGGARTMFVFYMAAAAALIWTRAPGASVVLVICCLPALLVIDVPLRDLLVSMRLSNLQSLGDRGLFWQAAVSNMDLYDWLFGFGLTHFGIFFYAYTGKGATDPHNWILSVFGMFGLPGFLFYLYLAKHLLIRCFRGNRKRRSIAIALALLFFGRDLGNTQYVLNHHPLACLYWIALGTVFCIPPEEEDRSDDADMTAEPVR